LRPAAAKFGEGNRDVTVAVAAVAAAADFERLDDLSLLDEAFAAASAPSGWLLRRFFLRDDGSALAVLGLSLTAGGLGASPCSVPALCSSSLSS
jgi:hypothetical protein